MAGGKPTNFTEEQAQVLRELAKRYLASIGGVQSRLAEKLGIGQQAVSTLVNGGGSTYQTASKLALLATGEGVDALFNRAGVGYGSLDSSDPLPERAKALASAVILLGERAQRLHAISKEPQWNGPQFAEWDAWRWLTVLKDEADRLERTGVSAADVREHLRDPEKREALVDHHRARTGKASAKKKADPPPKSHAPVRRHRTGTHG